ncbi:hypothetical protein JCM15519_03840 [Fundidesulfovibrio butyratiphilus]
MPTVTGTLIYGHTDAAGVTHADFEMRMPTLEDMEWAIEQAPENASPARLSRYIWARTLTRLGTLPAEAITPVLLGGLHYSEFNVLDQAEKLLAGKLRPASAA